MQIKKLTNNTWGVTFIIVAILLLSGCATSQKVLLPKGAAANESVATRNNTDGRIGFRFTLVQDDCVQDNVTGLMWEVKTTDGGLRDWNNTYTNFDNTLTAQKLDFSPPGYVSPTQDEIDAQTNSVGVINSVNEQGLCGYSDWRLPTEDELKSIVDYDAFPAIDANWFPNTQASNYWTASLVEGYSYSAWQIHFSSGNVNNVYNRYDSLYVRLVRAGH